MVCGKTETLIVVNQPCVLFKVFAEIFCSRHGNMYKYKKMKHVAA